MLNSQKKTMSDSSTEDSPLPQAPEFSAKHLKCCDVDVASIGGDIVYHFWPRPSDVDFPQEFAKKLEDAFKSVLPEDADVRAAYTDRVEAAAFMCFNETGAEDKVPVPTYYVRVIGWADNPMAETFLKQRVFDKLDESYGDLF